MAYTALSTIAVNDYGKASYANLLKANFDAMKTFLTGASDIGGAAHTHTGTTDGAVIGTNGVPSAAIQAGAVTQSKLSTTTSEVSTTGPIAYLTPTNTDYAFSPRFKATNAGDDFSATWWATPAGATAGSALNVATSAPGTSYVLVIVLTASGGPTSYAIFRYVQASPPYPLGGIDEWGPVWLYLHRRVSDGHVISAVWTEDPPHEGHWSGLPKGHPGRLLRFPHPFVEFWSRPLPVGEEIVLVDMRELAGAVSLESPAQAALREMVRRRDEWVAAGVHPADLARYEAEATSQAAREQPRQLPKHRALVSACGGLGRGPLAIIAGESVALPADPALPALRAILDRAAVADADVDPSDRAKLPRLTVGPDRLPWSDCVRVVRP